MQVQSSDSASSSKTGGGYNGYAIHAVAGRAVWISRRRASERRCPQATSLATKDPPATTQPRVSGYGKMEMYNGIPEGTPTEFYLANVTPDYAGKTLQIELFDPGDIGGDSSNSLDHRHGTILDRCQRYSGAVHQLHRKFSGVRIDELVLRLVVIGAGRRLFGDVQDPDDDEGLERLSGPVVADQDSVAGLLRQGRHRSLEVR